MNDAKASAYSAVAGLARRLAAEGVMEPEVRLDVLRIAEAMERGAKGRRESTTGAVG